MIETYLENRKNLRGIIQIMDIRHPPTPDDLRLWAWLKDRKLPALAVFTKADKIPRGKWNPYVKTASQSLGISPDDATLFSAETQQGRDDLLDRIARMLDIRI